MSSRGRKQASLPKGSKKTGSREISLLDLPRYRGYLFAWFSEIAIKLCSGKDLSDLNSDTVKNILIDVANCVKNEIEKSSKKGVEICKLVPVPRTGNDPGPDEMNLCYAQKTLFDVSMGAKSRSTPIPQAFSLEFAEYTRASMGPGKAKREIFVIDEGVLALALIGAYLSRSYAVDDEYGYIFIDIVPYTLALDSVKKANLMSKAIVQSVKGNDGSINVMILGISAAIVLAIGKFMRDIVRSDGHIVASFLRTTRTRNRILIKGYDTVDLIQLAKIVGRGGIAKAVYSMIRKYPLEKYNSLRRFIEVTALNLIKFQTLRKPQYIYEILRFLTSDELNNEGREWYVKKDKELSWVEIREMFSRLENLIA
ncbi:hypothetical protein QPL79_08540 [Ignisphaera sp. 4213-co]|uniref:Uncharacterized protein n=1 Tax=Ignisphaera cupida TaxID=3050454 RepID=A0ABD4Z8D4_9CREN|nr:hypothetical protein [Ignisphaera sp. 4213-co]MDK6029409.1 hypothetical protein [Ignisphaera sp. 4213-co]